MDEASIRDLLCGSRRGITAELLRTGLHVLSWGYSAAVRARNLAFDLGIRRSHRAPVPVVSIGNVTAGGTGKTPFVAHLVNWFRERDVRPAILSRGYRSLPGAANDEKLVLDQLCPGVPHLQDPDRVASAQRAVSEHGAQVLILDDGFQHRRLARDLDIVLIDALNPWGYGRLLPRGLLREPLSSLRRADVIVLTRADQCADERKREIIRCITEIMSNKSPPAAPGGTPSGVVEVAYPPERLVNSECETAPLASLAAKPLAAFCGIGNPGAFCRMLDEAGLTVADGAFRAFPDHHHYTPADLDDLARQARHAAAIVTTQKDLVKIDRTHLDACPLHAIRIGTRVLERGDLLERSLEAILDRAVRREPVVA